MIAFLLVTFTLTYLASIPLSMLYALHGTWFYEDGVVAKILLSFVPIVNQCIAIYALYSLYKEM